MAERLLRPVTKGDFVREDLEQVLKEIRTALTAERETSALATLVEEVHPADLADLYPLLDDNEKSQLIFMLPAHATAEVIAELDDADRGEAVEEMDEAALSEIVTELPPDDAADILADLTDEQREEVLEQIPDEQSDQLEELLEYEEDTAGGIMTPELVSLPESATIGEAIEEVRRVSEDEEIHYVYATDETGHLTGIVPLRRLVVNAKHTLLSVICERDPVTVQVDDDQELVANKIRRYDVPAVPVLDDSGLLIGRVTHDDVMDVAEEEAAEDIYYMAGTEAAELEEPSAVRAAYIRLRWLIFCMVGTALSGLMVGVFKGHFPSEVYLAMILFVPMMGAMGGNSGIQISTIIIRSLATGDLESKSIGRDFSRELPISLIMAPVCGFMAALITYLGVPLLGYVVKEGVPSTVSIPMLSLSVGVGMTVAIMTASILGMTLPHLFRKIGVDPAIASGPIVTTTNDIVSVTLYFVVGLAILR